tara:strand:- start:1514 stop:1954 length:441 start_codon:yes stop_codon:yes gene_type:complete
MNKNYVMAKILLSNLFLLQISLASIITYDDKQVIILLYEYFKTTKNAPKILGHSFHVDGQDKVFQIEIETDSHLVNDALLFSFSTIYTLAKISKTNFTHSILVIHFDNSTLPVVAESDLDCSNKLFNINDKTQEHWRKNCLTIKNY